MIPWIADLPSIPALGRRKTNSGPPAPLFGLLAGGLAWLAWTSVVYRGRIVSRASLTVPVPPQKVWEILSKVDEWPLWQPEIPNAGWLGRERWQPGARFRWTFRGTRFTSTVEAVDPPRYVAWGGPVWGLQDRHEWTILPERGGTRIETEAELSGWIAWVAAPWVQRQMNEGLALWLAAIAERSER